MLIAKELTQSVKHSNAAYKEALKQKIELAKKTGSSKVSKYQWKDNSIEHKEVIFGRSN